MTIRHLYWTIRDHSDCLKINEAITWQRKPLSTLTILIHTTNKKKKKYHQQKWPFRLPPALSHLYHLCLILVICQIIENHQYRTLPPYILFSSQKEKNKRLRDNFRNSMPRTINNTTKSYRDVLFERNEKEKIMY